MSQFYNDRQYPTEDLIWFLKSSNYDAIAGDKIQADTTTVTFTISLPSSPSTGQPVRVRDAKGHCGTNKLIVSRNGNKIRGLEDDYDLDWNHGDVEFVYTDDITGWNFATN